VLPLELGRGPQASVALDRVAPDTGPGAPLLVSRSVRECGFMRLRGAFAGPDLELEVGPQPGVVLSLDQPPPATAEVLHAWLSNPGQRLATALEITPRQALGELGLWLGLRAANACAASTAQAPANGELIPCLFRFEGRRALCLTLGLAGPGGLCLLGRAPGQSDEEAPFSLEMRCYGPSPGELAQELLGHLAAWHAAGRPGPRGLRLQVYPPDAPLGPLPPGALSVQKRWTRLVVDWPDPPA
jgi:protein-L-isoaspartate(D-aspartate) O-methyltransferase